MPVLLPRAGEGMHADKPGWLAGQREWPVPTRTSAEPRGRSRSGRPRTLRPDLLHPLQSLAQFAEPGVLVLAHQPDAPRQRIAATPRDAGVNQGVEHQALWLPEPRHDRHRERREHDRPVPGTHAPRHLAAVGVLGLLRDLDPVLPGLLAEPAAAAVPCRGLLSV